MYLLSVITNFNDHISIKYLFEKTHGWKQLDKLQAHVLFVTYACKHTCNTTVATIIIFLSQI